MVGKLFSQSLVNEVIKTNENTINERDNTQDADLLLKAAKKKCSNLWHLLCIPVLVILAVIFLVILLPILDQIDLRTQYMINKQVSIRQDECKFEIVESIPEGLVYPNSTKKYISTTDTWKKLIQMSENVIEIGCFYWGLRGSNEYPNESSQGNEVFNELLNAGLTRNISIKIARNKPSKNFPADETQYLIQKKVAQVKYLDLDALIGSGVLHTKFWIVDRRHFYLGSANLDWRSLTEVKELGIAFYNCSLVAEDLAKIFDVYWMVGNSTKLPQSWPANFTTKYNSKNLFNLELNGQKNTFYLSSSPPKFSPPGRNDDLDGLLSIIQHAKEFIHISVMDYLPLVYFQKPTRFWPAIDDELRRAVVERNVQVRLLISRWKKTKPMTVNFLKSLLALNKYKTSAVIEIKWFEVPSGGNESHIPYTRVNHDKYMVTDRGALIGTSNWSGDYFTSTAGVSLISPSTNDSSNAIQAELEVIFKRDWNSIYATPLDAQILEKQ